jgi:hypothetical protein
MKIKLNSNNISQYLLEVGISGEQDIKLINIQPKCMQGSNNLIFLTIQILSGQQLFVKQDYYYFDNKKNSRIHREWRLHNFLLSLPTLHQIYSLLLEIIHFDDVNSILIYKESDNYINLETYYKKKKTFSIAIAELVGTTLAKLHRETLNCQNCCDLLNQKAVDGKYYYQFPHPSHLLDRLEPETITKEYPPEGNRFMAFYHNSESFQSTVTKLVATHNRYCLTHNGYELNNILIPQSGEGILSKIERSDKRIIRLINWDKCSWGDPAFDVGTAIAGYLLLWLGSLIIHPAIKLEESLKLAIIPLEAIQPSVVTLTSSYISSFLQVLEEFPDFLSRVVQFTGLALLYKVIARIQSFEGFTHREICILQLAKSLLCQPEKSFSSIFGMTEVAFNELISFSKVNNNF